MSGETEGAPSGWTTDTLAAHLQQQINALERTTLRQFAEFQTQLERRFEAERHSVDLAFEAHRALTNATVDATDKAVQAALAAQKEAVAVAQATQERASQVLSEMMKHRDAQQNEWRGSLEDFNRQAMPRSLGEAWNDRASERIRELAAGMASMVTREELAATHDRESERHNAVVDRLTQLEASARGQVAGRGSVFLAITALGGILAIIILIANAWGRGG